MNTVQYRFRITTVAADVVRVSTRRHQFDVGRPIDFDVDSRSLSSLDYAVGALGAEVVSGLRVFAKRRRIVFDQIEAVVDGEIENPLTYLEVVGEGGVPALSRISIKVYVAADCDEDTLNRLWRETLARLPLVRALNHLVNMSLVVTPAT